MVAAIVGQTIVEYELDELIRPRFKRRDDDNWAILLGENGPLDSFNRKIHAAYAFGLIDEKTKDDLNVVRVIRNAFAHSRKILTFADDHICGELASSHFVPVQDRRKLAKKADGVTGRNAYTILCLKIIIKFLRRRNRAAKAANKRASKSPLLSALLRYKPPAATPPKSLLPPFPGGQSAGPKTAIPVEQFRGMGLLSGLFPDNEDK